MTFTKKKKKLSFGRIGPKTLQNNMDHGICLCLCFRDLLLLFPLLYCTAVTFFVLAFV